jgi:regulator of sigma E protease
MNILNILYGLLGISFLVFIHELGHFLFAKWAGVQVDAFAVGFGPPILKFRAGETDYRLNWIPLGGYVQMAGEFGNDEAAAGNPRLFYNRPIYARIAVIVAGVLFNILAAILMLSVANGFYGQPVGAGQQADYISVQEVVKNSPAEKSGIKVGDKIISVNGQKLQTYDAFTKGVQTSPQLKLGIDRHGRQIQVNVVPQMTSDHQKKIGVNITAIKKLSLSQSISEAGKQTWNMLVMIVSGLKQMVTGHAKMSDLAGPVKIIQITGEASQAGFNNLLSFLSLLSVNLAVLNILPLPALDGGRLVVLLIEFLRGGKRLKMEVEAMINTVGFGLLILLMVLVTIKDVGSVFK